MLHARALPPTRSILLVLAVSVAAAGCKAPRAFGDRNSLIVRADSALWAEMEDDFLEAVERRYYTNRPERIFNVTHVSSADTLWNDLRQWNQVVVVGTEEDPLVRDLADRIRGPLEPPEIFQVYDIWANGQTVTVLALPTQGAASSAVDRLPELFGLLQEQYREWVRQRMYASGVNDSLVSVLRAFGFALRLPRVYDYAQQDSLFRFKSAYPDQASLLRSVLVTWKADGAAEMDGEDTEAEETQAEPGAEGDTEAGPGPGELPDPDELRAWRAEVGQTVYDPHQQVLDEGLRYDTVTVDGETAAELRGVWQDETEFPAAGPFIARAVRCLDQNRTYYIDAWVYAPGKDKYLYVLQLEYLLDSFRCSDEPPVPLTSTFDIRHSTFEIPT